MALVALFALLALFLLEENVRGRVALHGYMKQLRDKGEKLTLTELCLTSLAEKCTEAAQLVALASELEKLREAAPHGLLFVSKLSWASPGRVRISQEQGNPRAGMMRFRSPSSALAAANPSFHRATWDDVAASLSTASNSLARARELLRQPPQSGAGVSSNLAAIGRIPHWLGAAAICDLRGGELDAATENVATIVGLTRFLQDVQEPRAQEVTMDDADVALDVTWHIMQAPQITDADLARLQRIWSFDEVIPDMLKTLEVERAEELHRYDEIRHNWREWYEIWRSMVGIHDPNTSDDYDFAWFCHDAQQTARLLLWRMAWVDYDKLQYLKQAQWVIDQARRVADSRNIAEFYSPRGKIPDAQNDYDCWRFVLSRFVAPDAGPLYKGMHLETRREMTLTAIALKRYHLRTGRFPTGLRELQPDFLAELPHDWLDGQPLRYRLNHDGSYTLYSVGRDRRDNGGDPSAIDPPRLASIWDGRDAVWPQPASER